MKRLILVALVVAAICFRPATLPAADALSVPYDVAYRDYQAGQPLVIVYSASWCGACQALKARLALAQVRFAVLDFDHPLPNQTRWPQIPVVEIWHRSLLVGRMVGPSVDQVQTTLQATSCPPAVATPIPKIPVPPVDRQSTQPASQAIPASPRPAVAVGTAGQAANPVRQPAASGGLRGRFGWRLRVWR